MDNWVDNFINQNAMPQIIKVVHIGDFIQVIYDEDSRLHGGFVTTLSSDAPLADRGNNKEYIIGLSVKHPHNNIEQDVLWASRIKKFRIIHK